MPPDERDEDEERPEFSGQVVFKGDFDEEREN
jgi:hypothetical protein